MGIGSLDADLDAYGSMPSAELLNDPAPWPKQGGLPMQDISDAGTEFSDPCASGRSPVPNAHGSFLVPSSNPASGTILRCHFSGLGGAEVGGGASADGISIIGSGFISDELLDGGKGS